MRWLLALFVLAAGCSSKPTDDRPVIVTAQPAVRWMVEALTDPAAVRVVDISGSGSHDLEPAPSQVEALATADLVVLIGGGFQPQIEAAAPDAVTLLEHASEPGVTADDPHFWVSPQSALRVTEPLIAALTDSGFTVNPAALDGLRRIADGYSSTLGGCASRTLITAHAAFSYLARDYSLEPFPLSGLQPEADPAASRIAEAMNLVRSGKASAVFAEEEGVSDPAVVVARDSGAKVLQLDTIEGRGDPYPDRLTANLRQLKEGLGCA